MEMLINSYIDDSQGKLKLLAEMSLETEQEAIFRMAHSLKGTGRNMGVIDFSNYCANVERLAKENQLTSADFNLEELEQLLKQAIEQLKSLLV